MSNQYGDFTISKTFLTVNVRDKRTRCYSYENTYIKELATILIPFGDKFLSFQIQKLSLSCLLSSSHLGLWSIMVTFSLPKESWWPILLCMYFHRVVFWMSFCIIPFSKIFLTVLFDTLTNNVSFLFLFLIKHLFKCVALLCIYVLVIVFFILYQCINVHVYTLI
jgi:hypothetical protein